MIQYEYTFVRQFACDISVLHFLSNCQYLINMLYMHNYRYDKGHQDIIKPRSLFS